MERRRKANVIFANGPPDARLKTSTRTQGCLQVVTRLACNMEATGEDLAQAEGRSHNCYGTRLLQVNRIISKTMLTSAILVILQLLADSREAAASSGAAQTQLDEYQLIGEARSQVRLPCLIGKQKLCGEPYFIAWYKLNVTSRQWARIEARSRDEPEAALDERSGREQQVESWAPNRPLSERVRFDGWSRETPTSLVNCLSPASEQTTQADLGAMTNQTTSLLLAGRHQRAKSAASLAAYGQLFDCAQLSISSLELPDEGQYKCEITFADSLDPERCPASTLTHLTVIARPNEPEILLNGRPAQLHEPRQLVFKEGAQVRLECQSSGGKPAPRIEWLNLTSVERARGERRHELQLLRSQWPIKRSHVAASAEQRVPLSSSSISLTLSRFDLQSRFVCLVVAPSLHQQQSGNSGELPASLQDASQLASQLDRLPMLSATHQLGPSSMIKWIKLDIMARPTSVSMQVLDLASNSLVAPNQMPPVAGDSTGSAQPFYLLRPNQLYAIQCLVENSRPRSQVAWFNRTSPIELETVQLDSSDFSLPQTSSSASTKKLPPAHRISSFTRFIEQSGTYRTVASLLLSTNFYDNFEELFCRVSNEAFQFDELLQVAPILSVRIYVNYPLSVWLEAPSTKPEEQIRWPQASGEPKTSAQLTGELGQRLQLRCQVAANPLLQNSILQIEWLKDGRRLQAPQPAPAIKLPAGSQAAAAPRVQIEKANHLHMPMAAGSGSASGGELGRLNVLRSGYGEPPLPSLAGSSRLLSSSLLTIGSLQRQDAGQYSCQFKLIPAPATPTGLPAAGSALLQQQQQQIKIVSGQASQPVQLRVTEAKLPVLRASSSTGLSLLLEQPIKTERSEPSAARALFLLADESDLSLQLKCDLNHQLQQRSNELASHQKVVWLLDGLFLASSSGSNLLNVTQETQVKRRLLESRPGRLSCALQTLEPAAQDSPNQFSSDSVRDYQSANAIELRWRQPPKLVRPKRRDLMPAARGFSELELSSQPATRLKLACLARCEPTCSIDWLFNGRSLAPLNDLAEFLGQRDPAVLKPGEPVNRFVRRISRLGVENTTLNLVRNDTQLHLAANRSVGGPAWLRHTSNLPLADLEPASMSEQLKTRGLQILTRGQLDRAAGQLLAELEESSDPAARANVFSKLELNYNQVSQLLASADDTELLIECRLNSLLDGREFSHAYVEPNVWFPSGDTASDDAGADESSARLSEPLSLADEKLFKSTPFNLSSEFHSNHYKQVQTDDTFSTRISLDGPPKRLFISLEPGAQPVSELQLNEDQLKQLLSDDELARSSAGPILNCSIGAHSPGSGAQFKWTFTSSSRHVNELLIESRPELNLKQLIDFRRRQIQEHASDGANRLELMANLFGNYTCTALSSRGTVSSSIALSYNARPVCRLTLHQQQVPGEHAVSFACEVYSTPGLMETVWLRDERPIASNKSEPIDQASAKTPFQPIVDWLRSAPNVDLSPPGVVSSPLSSVELPLSAYNNQREFSPTHLGGTTGESLACVARNSLGFSDPCELTRSQLQSLAIALGELNGTLSNKLDVFSATPNRISSLNQVAGIRQPQDGAHLMKTTSDGQMRAPLLARNWLAAHIDWLLLGACALAFVWLVFIFGGRFVRRRLLLTPDGSSSSASYGPASKMSRRFRFERGAGANQAGWRCQTSGLSRASSTNEFGLFASNKFASGTVGGLQNCYAAYGAGAPALINTSDSNGGDSSEHTDMVASCSQSSHYEDFLKHQLQQQQQQRAIYLNQNQPLESTTLSRRPLMNSSLSAASTRSHCNEAPALASTATFRQPIHASRIYSGQQQQAATSARSAASHRNQQQVPIIGTHSSSRIQFNELHARQPAERNFLGAAQQQTFDGTLGRPRRPQAGGPEHIYDDVIYNQMIL